MKRFAVLALVPVTCALLAAACFSGWPVNGPYACGKGCPSGMICDDGLCCVLGGAPACPTRVPDGGVCPDGSGPLTFYADVDQDGFGNLNAPQPLCSKPLVDSYVSDHSDCDDTSAEANPNGVEKCDGLDNNCNGVIDEGFAMHTYYRDQDGDSYGDPASTEQACAAPPGFVDNGSDCEPMDVNAHPGGVELCNGVDDDCDGVKDNHLTDTGGACSDAGFGVCAVGTFGCSGGVKVCVSTETPSSEKCDGLDNNCNGTIDEPPGCGGAPGFFDAGTAVMGGAQFLGSLTSAQLTAGCHKDIAGATAETFGSRNWTGSGGGYHVVWFENSGGTWDVSGAGDRLHLDVSWSMVNPGAPPWGQASLPVVFLCSANGSFNRYVHVSTDGGTYYTDASLLLAASGSFDRHIPTGGGNGWIIGVNGGDAGAADLSQVKRVEVLTQLPQGTFTMSFATDCGFN